MSLSWTQREQGIKVGGENAARNRVTIARAAVRLFRAKGIDGVGISEISRDAGLTHGALYAHFSSKEALVAEALAGGIMRNIRAMRATSGNNNPRHADYIDYFTSPRQGRGAILVAAWPIGDACGAGVNDVWGLSMTTEYRGVVPVEVKSLQQMLRD
jgi:AcrR family transcriptional regulator